MSRRSCPTRLSSARCPHPYTEKVLAFRGEGPGAGAQGPVSWAREEGAAYALVVDAKDKNAALLYRHYGFIACTDSPATLYLSLGR